MSILKQGFSYHVKDCFYDIIKDNNLMVNKENNGYRPHFCAMHDPEEGAIFWLIPISSQIDKYEKILDKKLKQYKKCHTIVIDKFGGKKCAFLIQNAFPIVEKYISHIHTIEDVEVKIHSRTEKILLSKLKSVIAMRRNNTILFKSDTARIYGLMKNELNSTNT